MTLYTQAEVNIRKTYFLMGIFFILIISLGWLLSYLYEAFWILVVAVIIAVTQSILSYWYSDKIILSSLNAIPVTKKEYPQLYRIVENLSLTAGLPMPKIYIINEPAPNAFATGRDPHHSVVCVTKGLLEKLNKVELEGVIAHELSHIGNRDILLSSVMVILVGIVALLARWFLRGIYWRDTREREGRLGIIILLLGILAAILAPLAATLLRLAVSRKREFLADASGALLTRYPEGLASALEKISQDTTPLRNASEATAHLFIASPFKKKKISWLTKLFSTHPPIEERIRILREMDIS